MVVQAMDVIGPKPVMDLRFYLCTKPRDDCGFLVAAVIDLEDVYEATGFRFQLCDELEARVADLDWFRRSPWM